MIKVTTNANAPLLIPNPDHRNFTEAGHRNFTNKSKFLPKGTDCVGEFISVEGLRKGVPFKWNLFKTNKNQFIFQKLVTPMEATEIKLGADAQVTPTKVDVPSNEKADRSPLVGALVGAGLGLAFAKYKKVEGAKKTVIYMAVGTIAGYVVGKMIANKKKITVKASK